MFRQMKTIRASVWYRFYTNWRYVHCSFLLLLFLNIPGREKKAKKIKILKQIEEKLKS